MMQLLSFIRNRATLTSLDKAPSLTFMKQEPTRTRRGFSTVWTSQWAMDQPLCLQVIGKLYHLRNRTGLRTTVYCSHLASSEVSWKETHRQKGFPFGPPPLDDTNWGTAATKGATTLPHVDDEGFVTVVTVLASSKYWVVMHPKQGVLNSDSGLQDSIFAYPPSWGDGPTPYSIFEAEGIELTPGDTL
jgi:hypothetical protein